MLYTLAIDPYEPRNLVGYDREHVRIEDVRVTLPEANPGQSATVYFDTGSARPIPGRCHLGGGLCSGRLRRMHFRR